MSNPVFVFASASAVLLALAFVVPPLIGSRHRGAIVGVLVFVPTATLAVYLLVGTPSAVDPEAGETGQIRSAVTDLAQRAMRDPENAEHWARLGLAYKRLEEFGSAEHAFRRALYIDGDADFLRAELAETLLYASGERQLPEEARRLLEQAAQGGSQKALWLLGLDAFQREAYSDAVKRFERLLTVMPADSNVRDTIEQYLDTARAGGPANGSPRRSEAAGSATLSLSIAIEETLGQRLEGDETVFVAVRRPSGGPPLAVQRLRASDLPANLTIGDDDAMVAGNELSSAEEAVVVARVSFTGDATPAPGDFEGRTDILPLDRKDVRAEVTIDQVR